MDTTPYDVVIIGAGQAGPPLAQALARAGKRVALAERKHLGGSCVNFGCTPTKAVIASAKVAHLARRGRDFGLDIPSVTVDFAAVLARAKGLVEESRQGLERGFSDNPRLLKGHARLEGCSGEGFTLQIGEQRVTAKEVVLNTGTRSLIPPIEGLENVDFLTAETWLDRPELPGHLAIIGGSYIGLEMGQFYRRMGSQVTIIESKERVASREDAEVSAALQDLLEAEGIAFRLKTKVGRVGREERGIALAFEGGAGTLHATHLMVATGRRPNTDDVGLETVGVKTDDKGFLEVSERLATSVPGIWAAGDIRGGPMFTHSAWDDHRVLESQLVGDGSRTTERIVPYAMFTDPELGRVGMTEREAKASGKRFRVATFEMKSNGKAREIGQTDGFIRVILEEGTGLILGAAVLAVEGSEMVHPYIALMNAGAPYTIIENAVHIHPTLAEAVQSALKG